MEGNVRIGCFFALVATILFANPATAEIRDYYRSGLWTAFDGTANDGKQVCGVVASGPDRSMAIKYFSGTGYITIHIVKGSWSIPDNTKVDIELQFGRETPWKATGKGYGKLIEIIVSADNVGLFFREFRRASSGFVNFTSGNEEGWSINLTGSSAATTVMTRCMSNLIAAQRAPTQPFSSVPTTPSQPFVPSSPSTSRPRQAPASPTGPGKDI
jgi:hypothetical protein